MASGDPDTHGPEILLAMSRGVSVEIVVSKLTPPKKTAFLPLKIHFALQNPLSFWVLAYVQVTFVNFQSGFFLL